VTRAALAWASALGGAVAIAGCSSKSEPAPSAAASTVHTIVLPGDDVVMPEGPGKAKLESGCLACHTPRYVLDQPPFPRKTWEAEVAKMRTAYGAPVAEEDVAGIVDYLVAVRGNGS
jgi:hypothetical protein